MKDYNAPCLATLLLSAGLLTACAHAPKKAPPPAPAPATVAAPVPATVPPPVEATAPTRYTVKKGDTLWGIASMYLKDPWLWPDIWYANPDVKNPHLIYPGDVLILGYNNGRPTLTVERQGQVVTAVTPPPVSTAPAPVAAAPATGLPVAKIEPQIKYLPLSAAVPALPLSVIKPFLSKTRPVDKSELADAGYLLSSMDKRPAVGAGDEMFARGLKQENGGRYEIYRLGDKYVDPDSGDTLGYQATYIGDAEVEAWTDPVKLLFTSAAQEGLPGDRFLPSAGGIDIGGSFMPHRPAKEVHGQIMAVLGGVAQIGQYNVVVLNRGLDAGVDPGAVLQIYRIGEKVTDPHAWFGGSVQLPQERSGTLMVFRSFKELSYALVMEATHEIHLKDAVQSP